MEDGGEFHTPLRGIPRGSALSPLLAAFHLTETDNVFSRNRHVTYARYMDDFLILSPTRWPLRRAVRMLNRHFAQAGFEQHPDKTFIGRVEKGFDWMGFRFTEKGCDGVAPRALQNIKDRLRQLYERVRQWPEDLRLRRMVGYVRNWLRWSSPPRQTPAQPVLQPGPGGRVTALSKYDIGDFSVDVIHLG
ncbi:reverse transcriptase domain-containing protein [Salmonella enterica]